MVEKQFGDSHLRVSKVKLNVSNQTEQRDQNGIGTKYWYHMKVSAPEKFCLARSVVFFDDSYIFSYKGNKKMMQIVK
jgi:hypothetical protein